MLTNFKIFSLVNYDMRQLFGLMVLLSSFLSSDSTEGNFDRFNFEPCGHLKN